MKIEQNNTFSNTFFCNIIFFMTSAAKSWKIKDSHLNKKAIEYASKAFDEHKIAY